MPLRMSVRPTAGHTRTPLGTGIIVALTPRRQPPQSGRHRSRDPHGALPANSISIAGTGGMATPSPARATTPERTHWPRLEDPAASDRSNSASRRPVAPRLAPLHLPVRRRYNRLLLLAAPPGKSQDRPEPRRLPSHRLLQWC